MRASARRTRFAFSPAVIIKSPTRAPTRLYTQSSPALTRPLAELRFLPMLSPAPYQPAEPSLNISAAVEISRTAKIGRREQFLARRGRKYKMCMILLLLSIC
jgi:hypothetical protein